MWLKKAIGLAGTAGQQIPSLSSLLATLAHSMHLLGVPLVCITPVVVLLLLLLLLPTRGPGEVKVPGETVAVALVLLDPAAKSRASHEQGRRLPCRDRLCLHSPAPVYPPHFTRGFAVGFGPSSTRVFTAGFDPEEV